MLGHYVAETKGFLRALLKFHCPRLYHLRRKVYLKRNILQIETERVAAILLSIVVLVLISEALSAWARAKVLRMK